MLVITGVETETTLPRLEQLLADGYTLVTWRSSANPSGQKCFCGYLDGLRWSLRDFITNLQHQAPIFEHAGHPGCKCEIMVESPLAGKEPIVMTATS